MESRLRLIKPSMDTKFKVDFEWWKTHDRNWHVYMRGFLCPDHTELFKDYSDEETIDWINKKTGEVTTVSAIENALTTHCSKQENFLTESSAMVDSVFRVFLLNGNEPLNCHELSEILGKPADLILRTFSSPQVYKGIKPV